MKPTQMRKVFKSKLLISKPFRLLLNWLYFILKFRLFILSSQVMLLWLLLIYNSQAKHQNNWLLSFLKIFPSRRKINLSLESVKTSLLDPLVRLYKLQLLLPQLFLNLLEVLEHTLLNFWKIKVNNFLIKEFESVDLVQSRLGLGHTFSRSRISLDVNRQDKPIIQSINLLDLLDKDINTFAMRIREWYSWHYPELAKIVTDNIKYVQCVKLIGVLIKFI